MHKLQGKNFIQDLLLIPKLPFHHLISSYMKSTCKFLKSYQAARKINNAMYGSIILQE